MPRKRAPRRVPRARPRADVQAVVDETIALFRWLAWIADQIYGDEPRGAAQRWLLRALHRRGAQTVPQLARARGARRQSLQPVVDALADAGLVALASNPEHARSKLVVLTRAGVAAAQRMDRVDARVLGAVSRGIPEPRLAATAATLRALRRGFETERWRAAVDPRDSPRGDSEVSSPDAAASRAAGTFTRAPPTEKRVR